MVGGTRCVVVWVRATDSGCRILDVWKGGRGFYMLRRLCGSVLWRCAGDGRCGLRGQGDIASRGGSSEILSLVERRFEGG